MIATRKAPVEEWILEHGDRCEFVHGAALAKPTSGLQHSKGQKRLATRLTLYEEATGVGCLMVEWHHRFGPPDDVRVYIPDLAFVLAPGHRGLPEYADEASDIMIEIASPHQGAELAEKVEFYLHNGARRVWVADPQRKCVDIYSPDSQPRKIAAGGILTDDLLPGFALPIAELFAS